MALPFCFHISTSNHQLPDELAIEDKWCTRLPRDIRQCVSN